MSEATYDSLEGEAYESEAYEGEAYEGEGYEGEAAYEGYGEESRADRRNRQRQIMMARQQQLQRQRRTAAARQAPRPRPAAAPAPRPATLNAVRTVELESKLAEESLRRRLEQAQRRAQWSTYSALATGAVSQALDTFEDSLADHPFVRAGIRLAPQALLPAVKERKGVEAVLLHPAFLATALTTAIVVAGKLTNDKTGAVDDIQIAVPSPIVEGDQPSLFGVAVDSKGRTIQDVTILWESKAPSVLRLLDPSRGQFLAVGTGPAEVTATAGGKTKSVTVNVVSSGISWPFAAAPQPSPAGSAPTSPGPSAANGPAQPAAADGAAGPATPPGPPTTKTENS